MDRAQCYGGSCEVCTAKVIRATHNTVGGVVEGEGEGFTLLGQLAGPNWGPGYTFNVRVAGTTAYLIRQDGLHIIDTTDPTNPTQIGLYRRAHLGYSNDVKLVDANSKRYALIADYGVDVVDVTNPANPTLVATIPEDAHTAAIEARGGKLYAYFGTYDGTCPIYDITDPEHPAKLGQFAVNGMLVHDLSIENGIAYLNAWDQGFVVVDYSNPAAPQQLGAWPKTPTRTSHSNWTTTINGRHIALHGEENYGAKLDLVDVDPAAPGVHEVVRDVADARVGLDPQPDGVRDEGVLHVLPGRRARARPLRSDAAEAGRLLQHVGSAGRLHVERLLRRGGRARRRHDAPPRVRRR